MLKKANVLHFIISRFLTLRYKETCCFKVLLLKKNIYTYSAANFILAVVTNIKQDYRFEFLKSSKLHRIRQRKLMKAKLNLKTVMILVLHG